MPRSGDPSGSDREPFATLREGPCFLRVAPAYRAVAESLGLLETGGLAALLSRGGGPTGRAPSVVIELPECRERLLVRPVQHGGWLAPLWGESILGPGRPSRELDVTHCLRRRGAPVPRPVFAAAQRLAGPFHRAAVATVFEEGTQDALQFLRATPTPARILRACTAAGRAIRRFHDAGGRHRDLHAGNLLLREGGEATECTVIDLDRASAGSLVTPRARASELGRLLRSVLKPGVRPRTGRTGAAEFIDAYTEGDAKLLEALAACWPRERRRLVLRGLST